MQTQQPDEFSHLALFDVAAMLTASKRISYRQATRLTAEATANVFTDKRLTLVDLRARFAEQGDQFAIRTGDLTVEVRAFGRSGYQRWLRNAGRWTTDRTLPKLEAALVKQVAAFREASA
jgi:hypothetical protein